jgi:hypothetical protein
MVVKITSQIRNNKHRRNMNHPNPKKHQIVSFLKSAVRITGYIVLPFGIELGVTILVISELIGIIEELV